MSRKFSGFVTASGKNVTVSEESLRNIRKLWDDDHPALDISTEEVLEISRALLADEETDESFVEVSNIESVDNEKKSDEHDEKATAEETSTKDIHEHTRTQVCKSNIQNNVQYRDREESRERTPPLKRRIPPLEKRSSAKKRPIDSL